ncbi:Sensory/regulatory protein RpfC [Zhongshania aliphaticivorans]|uniref:histidine kinase n=1 Tax=Zhongshania aliphaticivorans TaxID=1470434 RepID=A0A5S9PXA4_9GAMM|nr:PAS-domain containing protein [Zhongshania aliphaticivorans]CAA0109276.1 Sensory/regulatory protein RpfC [Zhongshania aliphaticivorans]CAA0117517.1 Sensory/regulatory protein RpfC [Zhongshania aliphaticivorans]
MLTNQWIVLLAFVYVGCLFLIAWWADRHAHRPARLRAFIYSLSLAVYCSSWTFFGAIGQAVEDGWSFVPIYLGPVLLFLFAWPFIRRLSVVSTRNRVTSIADFIGSRYGKHQFLAALVTLIAVAGSLPYIALQLKAVTQAWITVQHIWQSSEVSNHSSTSFIAALILVVFTVVFGTRVVDKRHRHRGLMAAIAVESVVKLTAFLAVGLFALSVLSSASERGFDINYGKLTTLPEPVNFVTQLLLAGAAIVCLPRQFHVMVVESHSRRDMRSARWIFPIYLVLFCLLIGPVAVLGQSLLGDGLSLAGGSADMAVVSAPLAAGSTSLAIVALMGGLSAATGMVIVACVTLSVMICNEWMVPLWQYFNRAHSINARWLQLARRGAIAAVLLAAWLVEQQLSHRSGLASIGLLSFAAAAQLLPAILAALYWPRAHSRGVIAGLFSGGLLWCYCLLLPALLDTNHPLLVQGLFDQWWLIPDALFGVNFLDPLSHGVFWSLVLNCLSLVLVSVFSRFRAIELRQARAFTQLRLGTGYKKADFELTKVEGWQLQRMLTPLLGSERSRQLWQRFEQRVGQRLLPNDLVPRFVVKEVEAALAAIVGAVSAHRTLDLLQRKKPLALDEFVLLIGDTSKQLQFGQDLLQVTLETIPQGISVVDANLDLVAWNNRYIELFGFPERLLYVGCPIAKVYQFNAERGYLQNADSDVDGAISRRLALLSDGKPYRIERSLPNGLVIEICGTPMARGGYVTTYTDISEYRRVFDELDKAKYDLEQRVVERTSALAAANDSLANENQARAKIERELNTVYASKSRFLAAASHDLLQPISAARLFTAALTHETKGTEFSSAVEHIDSALTGAENLITSLREVARLDSGNVELKRSDFCLRDILEPLARECALFAKNNGLKLRYRASDCWVYSDQKLLRRVIQNFLSNALQYTRSGGVLLASRRRGDSILIQVWDTGLGISVQDQQRVFDEFERSHSVSRRESEQGLGLGLSIVQRISGLLGHKVTLSSVEGRGSVFSISVPAGQQRIRQLTSISSGLESELKGVSVLCIDNEVGIRAGMQALLSQWGCRVYTGANLGEVLGQWRLETAPDIVLADFHLDNNETGLDLIQALNYRWDTCLPAVIISADNSPDVRAKVECAGYRFMSKPVKPAALRGVMRQLLQR